MTPVYLVNFIALYVNVTGVLSLRIGNQNMQEVGTGRFWILTYWFYFGSNLF